VRYGQNAPLGPDVMPVAGQFAHRAGGGLHQDAVEDLLMPFEQVAQLRWYGGDDVGVRTRERLGLPLRQPFGGGVRPPHGGSHAVHNVKCRLFV